MINRTVTGHTCFFDAEDYTKYLPYGFVVSTNPNGYRALKLFNGKYKNKYFARVLLGVPFDLEIDHIDGNTLNNTKANLRIVTRVQNLINREAYGESGLKGVYFNGRSWVAQIRVNGSTKYLGSWPIKSFADAAFKAAAEKYQKEFAAHICRD